MNFESLFSKVEFAIRVLDSKVGKSIVKRISDETFYNFLHMAVGNLTSEEKSLQVVNMLESLKVDRPWGEILTDESNLNTLRELLAEAKVLFGGKNEETF